MSEVEIRHAHFFCGLGGGAKGFNEGHARVGQLRARFRCIGGIDVDVAACRDFRRIAGVPATVLDLFARDQYEAFHGTPPPEDWREATPADVQRAFNSERPHIVFLSAPCKGFSGLLSEQASRSAKYQALNALTLRGVFLMLEAYKHDPVELILFENVPRIQNRGRTLLDQIAGLLQSYGYAVAETTHDCGELGHLAQSRKRFLLVARHIEKVPPFLYEPHKRPLRGVGSVLEHLPLPGPEPVLPMHRLPRLQWKTWVRLAFVEAGSDWRSLNRLSVENGLLSEYGIAPDCGWNRGVLGVKGWHDYSPTITSRGLPACGAFSVADPRVDGHARSVQHGVRAWGDPAPVVTGKMYIGGGPHAVADPRVGELSRSHSWRITDWCEPGKTVTTSRSPGSGALSVADPRMSGRPNFNNVYRIVDWRQSAGAVTSGHGPSSGGQGVADPRYGNWHPGASSAKLRVTGWDQNSFTVTGSQQVASGALSVADPRPGISEKTYKTQGHYGVVPWGTPSGSVTGKAKHDTGRWSVADPRAPLFHACAGNVDMPEPSEKLVCMIRALDGTWHRPFTTLELAALQGLVDPEETLELDGLSDSAWRERIGNAVPPPAATAIAGVMGRTLLLAWSGETFTLSNEDIWVRQIAAGLSVDQRGFAAAVAVKGAV